LPDTTSQLLGIQVLSKLHDSLREFRRDVVNAAESHLQKSGEELAREQRAALKEHDIILITEFYYIFWALGDVRIDRLEIYLRKHNEDMAALVATDVRGTTACGISTAQIKKSLLSETQIRRVIHESSHGRIVFDQQSIQKLLRPKMSPETTRTRLLVLAETGLLNRNNVGTVLYSSPHKLEQAYHRHLIRLGGLAK
jgi:hypothetical protein